jgi:hypothetical protein
MVIHLRRGRVDKIEDRRYRAGRGILAVIIVGTSQ